MKVKHWLEVAQEVEVDVSIAEVMASIDDLGEEDRPGMLLDCVNRVYAVLRNATDLQIARLLPNQRAIIARALREQAARFDAA